MALLDSSQHGPMTAALLVQVAARKHGTGAATVFVFSPRLVEPWHTQLHVAIELADAPAGFCQVVFRPGHDCRWRSRFSSGLFCWMSPSIGQLSDSNAQHLATPLKVLML